MLARITPECRQLQLHMCVIQTLSVIILNLYLFYTYSSDIWTTDKVNWKWVKNFWNLINWLECTILFQRDTKYLILYIFSQQEKKTAILLRNIIFKINISYKFMHIFLKFSYYYSVFSFTHIIVGRRAHFSNFYLFKFRNDFGPVPLLPVTFSLWFHSRIFPTPVPNINLAIFAQCKSGFCGKLLYFQTANKLLLTDYYTCNDTFSLDFLFYWTKPKRTPKHYNQILKIYYTMHSEQYSTDVKLYLALLNIYWEKINN